MNANENRESIDIFFKDLYKNFNDRNIELVISEMTDDVKWANGMEGGYVYGHEGVRDYWTRQFNLVSSNVTPIKIDQQKDYIKIKVHQVVHDLLNNLLADEYVYHMFRLKKGKIVEFNIGEKVE